MKTYLNVPFHQKDRAKALGARFDMAKKAWFVPDGLDLYDFREWLQKRDEVERSWGRAQSLMGLSRKNS